MGDNASTPPAVALRAVSISFRLTDGGVYDAVAPTDLVVAPGEFVAIVGPTGKLLLIEQKSGLLNETVDGLKKSYADKEKSVPIQMARNPLRPCWQTRVALMHRRRHPEPSAPPRPGPPHR